MTTGLLDVKIQHCLPMAKTKCYTSFPKKPKNQKQTKTKPDPGNLNQVRINTSKSWSNLLQEPLRHKLLMPTKAVQLHHQIKVSYLQGTNIHKGSSQQVAPHVWFSFFLFLFLPPGVTTKVCVSSRDRTGDLTLVRWMMRHKLQYRPLMLWTCSLHLC